MFVFNHLSWILTVFLLSVEGYQCWTRDDQSPVKGLQSSFKHLHLHDVFLCCFWCWTHRPSSFPLLGWLRGFIQSKLSTALDDPWPTGRVEGSARTPLPIHVSQCHSIIDTHTNLPAPLNFTNRPLAYSCFQTDALSKCRTHWNQFLSFLFFSNLGKWQYSKVLIPLYSTNKQKRQ